MQCLYCTSICEREIPRQSYETRQIHIRPLASQCPTLSEVQRRGQCFSRSPSLARTCPSAMHPSPRLKKLIRMHGHTRSCCAVRAHSLDRITSRAHSRPGLFDEKALAYSRDFPPIQQNDKCKRSFSHLDLKSTTKFTYRDTNYCSFKNSFLIRAIAHL